MYVNKFKSYISVKKKKSSQKSGSTKKKLKVKALQWNVYIGSEENKNTNDLFINNSIASQLFIVKLIY